MAVTLILALLSVAYLIQAWHLSVGTMNNLGPGAYPIGLGFFMLFCLGLKLVKDLKEKKTKTGKGLAFRWQIWMGLTSLGYALILERVGYLASTVLYATVMALIFDCTDSHEGCMSRTLTARTVVRALLTGLAITALGYLLFHVLFNFRLP